MQYAYRRDFPPNQWIGGIVPANVQVALEAIDPSMEIIYDRSTAEDGNMPAHHLYRRLRTGGVASEDYFILQASLQEDMSQQWPHGRPKRPDPWIIDWIRNKRNEKLSGGRSIDEMAKNEADLLEAAEVKAKEENQAEYIDATAQKAKDLATFGVKGKVSTIHRRAKR